MRSGRRGCFRLGFLDELNYVKEYLFNEYFIKEDASIPAPRVYAAKIFLLTGHLCLITEMMDDCMEHLEIVDTDISSAKRL